MFFSELNNALSLVTRTTSWLRHRETSRQSVARRFVRLFAARGIHRNQMNRVLGLNATLADVQTDESLVKILTDELLDKAARLFAVRREWLEGATEKIYPTHDFYKQSDRFPEFLDSLLANASSGALRGVLLVAESHGFESNALLVWRRRLAASVTCRSAATSFAIIGIPTTGSRARTSPPAWQSPEQERSTSWVGKSR